jgi:hypothetical protein
MHVIRFSTALLIVVALVWVPESEAAPPLALSPSAHFAPVPAGPPDRIQPDPNIGPADPTDSMSGVAFLSSEKARRLGLRPEGVPRPGSGGPVPQPLTLSDGSQYTLTVTNDAQQDTEPTVRTLTIGSTTYTTVASIKYLFTGPSPNRNRFRNYFATTTDFSTWTRGELPMPTGYKQSGDPLMDENSYTTGIAPLRKYVTGIIYQDNSTSNDVVPNAIGVWHSDDGGLTWSQPTLVAVNSDPLVFLDKPAINVSQWFGNNGTVFVAYIKINFPPNPTNHLLVARSTDGGVTFSAPSEVTSGDIEGPQILTSPYGDKVYALWADYSLNAMRMSTSSSSLLSWTAGETATTGSFLPNRNPTQNLNGGTGVRAVTLPMARYNWVKNSVSLVWHEFESSTSDKTDIFYVAKTSSGWQAKKRVNPTTLNDQFMPGFDFDSSGRFMVTFYDRSQDPNNLLYKESWARIDYLGNVLGSGALSVPPSDPNAYLNKFIGDYQDSWWWNFSDQYGNRFNAAWVEQTSSTTGNIYVTGIQ